MGVSLVIMAAGMGSRFGGLKQMEPVGLSGETIAEFSVYDAMKAGFSKVYFIIKREMEADFRARVTDRIGDAIPFEFIYQDINNVPLGFTVPEGRKKPWGTAHAAMCCDGIVNEPFMLINADDFYGREAFYQIFGYLSENPDTPHFAQYCMVGYKVKNTVSESGSVSRGVCELDANDFLTGIEEYKRIETRGGEICYTEDGEHYKPLSPETVVSLNAFGFQPSYTTETKRLFAEFLENNAATIQTAEFYLPWAVMRLLETGRARMKVLPTNDSWYGFTYKEDMPMVQGAITRLIEQGVYPESLWG